MTRLLLSLLLFLVKVVIVAQFLLWLLLMFVLLSTLGCSPETVYVSDEGLELFSCGTQLCLEVTFNGYEVECVYDTGANGTIWLSEEVADGVGLFELWCYYANNSFGDGQVRVCMRSAAAVCWQVEGEEVCQETYPYSVEMIHDCLFGLE